MPARKIVRSVTRYEVLEDDLAKLLGIPDDLQITGITFHGGTLRIFTADREAISQVGSINPS